MTAAAPSRYADWLMSDAFRPDMKQHLQLDGPSSILRVRLSEAGSDPPTGDVTVQLVASGSLELDWDFSAGRQKGRFNRGDLVVTPPWVPLIADGRGRAEVLVFAMPEDELAGVVATEEARLDLGLLTQRFADTAATGLLTAIWAEAEAGLPNGRLFIEGAKMMIASRLLSRCTPPRVKRYGLSGRQLRRATEMLTADLEAPPSLKSLAAEAGLSPAHFSRAFKATTGTSPWRWLAVHRVARAKDLLVDPTLTLTDVAQMCGYSGQGPFGEAFRRETGITPGQYRRGALQ